MPKMNVLSFRYYHQTLHSMVLVTTLDWTSKLDKLSRPHKLNLEAYRQINHSVIFWEALIIF